MNFLGLFRSQKPAIELQVTLSEIPGQVSTVDKRIAECPACHQKLAKIPGAKTKCPHCSEFMYVRTQTNHMRIVVTKAQAEEIEKQWMILNGTYEAHLAEKTKFADEKQRLAVKRGGRQPPDNDVQWALLNTQLITHASQGDWGLYRNARFQMAEILRGEQKKEAALFTYLEVCYLDLNGPRNVGGCKDASILKEYPPFDPKSGYASLAGGVVARAAYIIKELEMSLEEVGSKFITQNSKIKTSLKLPLDAKKAWDSLKKEFV